MNGSAANKRSRQERALVHVRNRIDLWSRFGQVGVPIYQGKTVDPAAKLNMALQEEADLLKKGIK